MNEIIMNEYLENMVNNHNENFINLLKSEITSKIRYLDNLINQNNVTLCFALEDVPINIAVDRNMYDDMPCHASYCTNCGDVIKKGKTFMNRGTSLFNYYGTHDMTGVGNAIDYKVYLKSQWKNKVKLCTPQEYMLMKLMEDEYDYLNRIEHLKTCQIALPIYEYAYKSKTNYEDICSYMQSKGMDSKNEEMYFDNLKMLGRFLDCPERIRKIADVLVSNNDVLDACKVVLDSEIFYEYDVYHTIQRQYPDTIEKINSELQETQNYLNYLREVKQILNEIK